MHFFYIFNFRTPLIISTWFSVNNLILWFQQCCWKQNSSIMKKIYIDWENFTIHEIRIFEKIMLLTRCIYNLFVYSICLLTKKKVLILSLFSSYFKNFAIFTGKHLCWSIFFNNVPTLRTPNLRSICKRLLLELFTKTCYSGYCNPIIYRWVIRSPRTLKRLLLYQNSAIFIASTSYNSL